MAGPLEYIKWRGDLSFEVSPSNEVDYFLLCMLSVPDFSGIVGDTPVSVAEAAEIFFSDEYSGRKLGVLQSANTFPAFESMARSVRFRDILISNFERKVDADIAEQFSAITALLPDGTLCICFSGTDDTIIGWKEDFNIAVLDEVPSQQEAVDYINRVATGFCGDIVTCGHSKGGNLSAFAAAKADPEIKEHLRTAYNFDGPGFRSFFLDSPDYTQVRDRINTIISQNTTVGTLLKSVGNVTIVKSNVRGASAHDCFNWEVLGTEFLRMDSLSAASRAFDRAMDETLESMSLEERREFTDDLFDMLLSSGAETITDFVNLKAGEKLDVVKNIRSDKRVHAFVTEVLEKMIKALR